ncbi:hypothetical protein HYFRA_00011841 [Hymenoscyphus fraxineus]|uniref:Uncharacterized protein n=1 Tax=Hymenoscyphus fraxineus TaxID=746836 RepID=A0A9N9L0H7_9HELO|nr:hypothetical protein HYFRA_00011841 [Hymenoscyphus fraxineus]
MVPDSSLEEASLLFQSFIRSNMEKTPQEDSEGPDNIIPVPTATITVVQQVTVQDEKSLITSPPRLELLRRVPQNDNQELQRLSQSAAEAVRQAQQLASQSIGEIQRQAAEATRQASQSAAQAIQQAQQQAQQTIAQISRSADQAVAAATQSANQAVAQARSEASQAVDKANERAQTSLDKAAAQINTASTEVALAIVGSIIASTLITILIFFLVNKHKKAKRRLERKSKEKDRSLSPTPSYGESNRPASEKASTNSSAPSNERGVGVNDMATTPRGGAMKYTEVKWNPNNPPQAPTLANWLMVQDGVSPYRSIALPTDEKNAGPLGGQLKSPLRSIPPKSTNLSYRSSSSPTATKETRLPGGDLPFRQNAPARESVAEIGKATIKQGIVRQITVSKTRPSLRSNPSNASSHTQKDSGSDFPTYVGPPIPEVKKTTQRQSGVSAWTDDKRGSDRAPSSIFPSPPTSARGEGNGMEIPQTRGPVRTTAQWLESIRIAAEENQQDGATSNVSSMSSAGKRSLASGSGIGLPSNPRIGGGLPGNPRGDRKTVITRHDTVQSHQGELGNVEGGSLSTNQQGSLRSRASSVGTRGRTNSVLRVVDTPSVGRAL